MEKLTSGFAKIVHSWDAQRRANLCGAPGQIGSTKHARSVTCAACLEQLSAREAAVAAVPR